tara:strand:- start:338 stop:670 length:333 start_codon:yes stop_codon:yes gene_type:complete
LKNSFFLVLFIFSCTSLKAGLNQFTALISVDEWLIERKIDLINNEIKCRASIPTNASWFGARIRLGLNNELITPIWISMKEDQILDLKLAKVKKLLNECRSGFLFLPDDL